MSPRDVWDPLNRETIYDYNTDTGELVSVKNPKDTEATKTEYRYDDLSRLEKTFLTTDTDLSMYAEYVYSGARLTQIKIPGTNYNFSYGDFGLRSQISVGNWYLVNYEYQPVTHLLDRMEYHNGHTVEYTYDQKGRGTRGRFSCPLFLDKNRNI